MTGGTLDARAVVLSEIQAPVRVRLDEVVREMRRITVAEAPLVAEVAAHLLGMRGKMLRPTLVLLSSDIGASRGSRAVRLAAVVELVHLATLVHDDAVDHSVLRRGMPTVNALFSHQISVIMGDFLYARSLHVLVTDGEVEALRALTRASSEMTVGELRQLGTSDPLEATEEDYVRLIAAKTASLMGVACELGALTGAPEHREPMRRFGEKLGMAFQVVDDLLDLTGEEATTGKPHGLDIREGKATLPLIAAWPELDEAARASVRRAFNSAAVDEGELRSVVHAVANAGGLDYARERALAYGDEAEAELDGLPECPAIESLRRIVRYVLDRRV